MCEPPSFISFITTQHHTQFIKVWSVFFYKKRPNFVKKIAQFEALIKTTFLSVTVTIFDS